MMKARSLAANCEVKVVVFWGWVTDGNNDYEPTYSIEVFDHIANTWPSMANMI